jgi:hypothetical protein
MRFRNMERPILVYILITISDIAITVYGLSIGYNEGNPILGPVANNMVLIISALVIVALLAVVLFTVSYRIVPARFIPVLTALIYTACIYRFVFGTLSWSWLFTGYQPEWIIGSF